MSRHIGFQSILAAFLFFAFSGFALAEAPPIINYEGTLADTEGNPVPDGNYEIQFGIFSAFSGGPPPWSERWDFSSAPIAVRNGKFNVLLGSHSPFPEDLFGGLTAAYIGIRVGNDVEMQPRQRIASVPYALYAGTGGIPSGGIIMWSGSVASIPQGWALCDGTNGTPDLKDRFVISAGVM